MVSGATTSVRDNRSKSHTPDLDPNFIKELMRSLKTSYKFIGGKNLKFPSHFKQRISALGPIDAVKHYKYHTGRYISAFSFDVLERPEGFDENLWFFNHHNRVYMTRRLKKFRYAFQLWQGKRAINAPLPEKVKEADYQDFKSRLTAKHTMDPFMLMAIKDKADKYFKDFIVPGNRMSLTTKSCFERSNMSEFVHEYYEIPHMKPYKTLHQLTHHNIAAKFNYNIEDPRGQSVQLDEPLKVRTITKMSHSQMLYKDVQVALLRYIQNKSPEFVLTKGQDIEKAIKYIQSDYPLYCSGDYQAATDHLKRILITTVVSSLQTNRLDKQFGDAIIDDFLATNGQLMGSILSFPLLCVINKFVYEYTQDLVPNESSKPLINGDDILYKGTEKFIRRWFEVTREAGFIPSKGKSLVDKNNFTINSRPFNARGMQRFANFKLVRATGNIHEEVDNLKKFHELAYGETITEQNLKKSLQYFPNFGKSKSFRIWRKFKSEYMPKEAGGLELFTQQSSKLTNLQKMYTCTYLTTVRKQPLTQLQREVGVNPFIAKESFKEPIPKKVELLNYPRDFVLDLYECPKLNKLRYGMLSSRIRESEGVRAFHQ